MNSSTIFVPLLEVGGLGRARLLEVAVESRGSIGRDGALAGVLAPLVAWVCGLIAEAGLSRGSDAYRKPWQRWLHRHPRIYPRVPIANLIAMEGAGLAIALACLAPRLGTVPVLAFGRLRRGCGRIGVEPLGRPEPILALLERLEAQPRPVLCLLPRLQARTTPAHSVPSILAGEREDALERRLARLAERNILCRQVEDLQQALRACAPFARRSET